MVLENWIKIAVEEIFEKHGILNLKYDSDLNGIVDNAEALQGLTPEVSGGSVFQIPSDLGHGDIFAVDETLNITRFIPGTSGNYLTTRGSNYVPIWAEGGGGVTDHGALTGLGDDDHSQYYNSARHTKAIHDSLNINAGQVDGCDAGVATGNVFKLPAGLAQGDIFYVNSSGNVLRLGYGTSGHFLKTQGAGANPIWAAALGVSCLVVAANDTPSILKNRADYACDGAADQSEINIALGVANTVILCPGTYNLSASIVMADNKTLIGSGAGTILNVATGGITGITNSEHVSGNRNITIKDLKLYRSSVGTEMGIWLWYTSPSKDAKGALIDNVITENIHTGIYLRYCHHCIVSNCKATNDSYSGLVAKHGGDHTFSNCISTGSVDNGINVCDADDSVIIGCHAVGCYDGISVETNSNRVGVIGCHAYENTHRGLYINSMDDGIIMGNIVFANSQHTTNIHANIHLEGSDRNLVQGNTPRAGSLTKKPIYGIYIYSGNNNRILDNDLYDDGYGTSTLKDSATDTIIRGNPGYNPVGISSISVGASEFTHTAGASPETIYIHGGTVSLIKKGTTTIFTDTGHSVELEPYELCKVTYSGLPTMYKDVH